MFPKLCRRRRRRETEIPCGGGTLRWRAQDVRLIHQIEARKKCVLKVSFRFWRNWKALKKYYHYIYILYALEQPNGDVPGTTHSHSRTTLFKLICLMIVCVYIMNQHKIEGRGERERKREWKKKRKRMLFQLIAMLCARERRGGRGLGGGERRGRKHERNLLKPLHQNRWMIINYYSLYTHIRVLLYSYVCAFSVRKWMNIISTKEVSMPYMPRVWAQARARARHNNNDNVNDTKQHHITIHNIIIIIIIRLNESSPKAIFSACVRVCVKEPHFLFSSSTSIMMWESILFAFPMIVPMNWYIRTVTRYTYIHRHC